MYLYIKVFLIVCGFIELENSYFLFIFGYLYNKCYYSCKRCLYF